jgi:molecular chaperone DnaJ
VPVTFSQAALGCVLEVPTLDGVPVTHNLKAGIQGGEEVRIPGKGMPHVRGGRAGDLVVHVRVVTPRSLTRRQEELFRELAEIEGKHVGPEHKSWLERVRDFFSSNTPAETPR